MAYFKFFITPHDTKVIAGSRFRDSGTFEADSSAEAQERVKQYLINTAGEVWLLMLNDNNELMEVENGVAVPLKTSDGKPMKSDKEAFGIMPTGFAGRG